MASINRSRVEELVDTIEDYHFNYDQSLEEEEALEVAEQYTEKLNQAKKDGLYEIGEGRHRITFESRSAGIIPDGCVLKISKVGGTEQNREAIEIWESMDEEARACVAPLVDWADDYRWIVQRQASHTAYGSEEVREKLKEAGWTCSDIRAENIGELDGEKVLIDLGVGLREI